MAEYTSKDLGVRMVVKDTPTVREQLRYTGEIRARIESDAFEKLWHAAKPLIETWECEHVALDVDLDAVTNPNAAKVIRWAGIVVFSHMQELDILSKNS